MSSCARVAVPDGTALHRGSTAPTTLGALTITSPSLTGRPFIEASPGVPP